MVKTPTRSTSKLMLIQFLKSTKVDDENNSLFAFTIRGDEALAKRFVHRMRVDLARMREAVKELNKIPKHFKVMVRDYEYDDVTNKTKIILCRTESSHNVDNEIMALLSELATDGEQVNG